MPATTQTIICVQSEWDGWKTAEVQVPALAGLHWRQPGGAPRPLLHGYIYCSDIINGEVPHACADSDRPHRLLVCVLRRHSLPSTYAELACHADEHQLPVVHTPPAHVTHETARALTTARGV
jgi:hypothetical protein